MDHNGNLYSELNVNIAADFFLNLFTYKPLEDLRFIIPLLFPPIDNVALKLMDMDISDCEVKNALFDIGGLKAPSVDGFPALFY